ncbi:copper resistance CopC family protein [Nonomuraea sp. KM88]|uniref:copper resistance CopC family protein n=1 Tax=Nonomuraea sp. KM88 TaxID=3457427 RepID=UPI003FCD6BDE
MRRLLTVLLLAFAAAGIALSPAEAHNVLIGSDPKDGATLTSSPARVTLVFDQPVRQGYAQVGVTGADGSAWADGAAEIAAERVSVKVKPLAAGGSYVVGYRILSADGHPVTGKIGFSLAADATADQGTNADPAEAAADPDPAEAAADPAAAEAAADPAAAEAAANGGAGMAVVWIVGALLLLALGTAVALRRAKPAQETALTSPPATATPGTPTDPAPATGTTPDPAPGATTGPAGGGVAGSAAEETKA